ncbi:hypothetical protein [Comamonas sp. JC664]
MAYGDKVILSGLQLQIAPCAVTALMGPVGGGKSPRCAAGRSQ